MNTNTYANGAKRIALAAAALVIAGALGSTAAAAAAPTTPVKTKDQLRAEWLACGAEGPLKPENKGLTYNQIYEKCCAELKGTYSKTSNNCYFFGAPSKVPFTPDVVDARPPVIGPAEPVEPAPADPIVAPRHGLADPGTTAAPTISLD